MTARGSPKNGMTEKDSQPQKTGPPNPHPLKRYYDAGAIDYLLTLDEVAAYFSIGVRTVYRLIDEGDLHTTRIRGCVRVSAKEIQRYEEKLAKAEPH